jgi:broad specificity phosphatase PhoE
MLPAQDIIIIRHAERYGNEITQEGEEQAKELGKLFASEFLNNNPQ